MYFLITSDVEDHVIYLEAVCTSSLERDSLSLLPIFLFNDLTFSYKWGRTLKLLLALIFYMFALFVFSSTLSDGFSFITFLSLPCCFFKKLVIKAEFSELGKKVKRRQKYSLKIGIFTDNCYFYIFLFFLKVFSYTYIYFFDKLDSLIDFTNSVSLILHIIFHPDFSN